MSKTQKIVLAVAAAAALLLGLGVGVARQPVELPDGLYEWVYYGTVTAITDEDNGDRVVTLRQDSYSGDERPDLTFRFTSDSRRLDKSRSPKYLNVGDSIKIWAASPHQMPEIVCAYYRINDYTPASTTP